MMSYEVAPLATEDYSMHTGKHQSNERPYSTVTDFARLRG